jgi:hypothetical protein
MSEEAAGEEAKVPRALGWGAIDGALAKIYGEGEPPYHFAPLISAALGGPDPLQGISVYERATPVPHWHYVTYGFSELYEKESEDLEYSGFGFELTFRLALLEEQPPRWPLDFLNNLARYVFRTGNCFNAGHYLHCNGPIALGTATDIRAILFAPEPELGEIDTPNGRLEFLQVVGITADELLQVKKWNAHSFLRVLGEQLPLLITDLDRHSILRAEDVRRLIQEKAESEGSNTSLLAVGEVSFLAHPGRTVVVLGANGIPDLKELLPLRLEFSRPLTVASTEGRIHFVPGTASAWRESQGGELEITLAPEQAQRLAGLLQPRAGTYSLPDVPELSFEVRKSEIKDAQGNTVEVIG